MGRRQFLNMDSDYSRALVGAALKSGFASHNRDVGPTGAKMILDDSASRLRRPALEMAVIFEKVNLFGIPPTISLERLRNEGMLGMSLSGSQVVEEGAGPPPDCIPILKRSLSEATWRRSNRLLRFFGEPPARRKLVSDVFDVLASGTGLGLDITLVRDYYHNLVLAGHGDTRPVPEEQVLDVFGGPLLSAGYDPLAIIVCTIEVLAALISFWNLIVFSVGAGDPFLSHHLFRIVGSASDDPTDRLRAYDLCQITMTEELGYAPVINGFDDVLRLRHDRRIVRFRRLLEEWCTRLPEGDVVLLKTIKADIQKANKELRHLDRWRTVDRWLFWAQLPTVLIPVVSTIATVLSFGVHLKLENSEKNSWIGIGR